MTFTTECCQKKAKKHGRYQRQSDGRVVQRYQCQRCRRTFSSASTHPAKWQKKRQINYPLLRLLSSGVSMNRSALILGVNPKTIAIKLEYLASQCQDSLIKEHKDYANTATVQFDELQTIEHTKCKPLSVAVAVCEETRKILGFEVSTMPATGHLAKLSRKKYGYRPDDRPEGLLTLFERLDSFLSQNTVFKSDLCSYYRPVMKRFFPQSSYIQTKGDKATIAGQGELKKRGRDPIFSINHTLAMMRANINRLIRRTWCTTKRKDRLAAHLWVYCWFHNMRLTPGMEGRVVV